MPMTNDQNNLLSDREIFKGLKFFLVQRVPTRSHWINLIREHGGTVVPLDKKADIVIADHARKDCPPDSITWRFIQECHETRRLMNKEAFRIGRLSSQQPRPTASREAPKQGRAAFTNEDDCILTAWVTSRDNPGGNKIYQELEAEYPHHTWQSWRNRWVKKLRNLPPDIREAMASKAPPLKRPASPPPAPSEPRPRSRAKPRPRAAEQPLSRISNSVLHEEREESPGFTQAEDKLLVEHVKSMVQAGNRWKSRAIYEEFAKEYPQHSAVSWKDRFTLMWRKREVDMEDWIPSHSHSGQLEVQPVVSEDEDFTPQPRRQASPRKRRRSPAESARRRTTQRHPSVSDDDSFAPQAGGESPAEPAVYQASERLSPEPLSDKDRFYDDLEVVAATISDDAGVPQLERWECIGGRDIELWDIYQNVVRQGCPIDDVEWRLVAEHLKLEWIEFEDLSEKLRDCWYERLDQYHRFASDFQIDDVDNEEVGAVGDDYDGGAVEGDIEAARDEVVVDKEEDFHEQETPQPRRRDLQSISCSPSIPRYTAEKVKRRREPSPILANPPMRKRKRIERSVEIPTTPEWAQEPAGDRSSRSRRKGQKPDPVWAGDVAADAHAVSEYQAPPSRAPSRTPVRQEQPAARPALRRLAAPEAAARPKKSKPCSSPAASASTRRRTLPPAFASGRRTSPSGPSIHDDDHDHGTEAPRQDTKQPPDPMPGIPSFTDQGYSLDIIRKALYRAAQAPAHVLTVMKHLKRGKGVPEGIRGVWTEADDKALWTADAVRRGEGSGGDAEERRRRRKEAAVKMEALVKKHGSELVEERRDFLAQAEKEKFPMFSC